MGQASPPYRGSRWIGLPVKVVSLVVPPQVTGHGLQACQSPTSQSIATFKTTSARIQYGSEIELTTVFGVARGPVGQRGARGRVRARFQNLTRAELPPGAAVATARSIDTPVTDSALINIGPITIFTLCTVRNVWVD